MPGWKTVLKSIRVHSPLGIRGRFLALGITGVVSIVSLGGGAVYMNMRVAASLVQEERMFDLLNSASRLRAKRDELRGDVYKSVWSVRNNSEFEEDIKLFKDSIAGLREYAEQAGADPSLAEGIRTAADRADAYVIATTNVLTRSPQTTSDVRNLLAKFEGSYGSFRLALENVVEWTETSRDRSKEDLEAAVVAATFMVAVIGLVCFIVLSVIGESSRRRIGVGVATITESMRRMSEGDLTVRVLDETGDEITEIAGSANQVVEAFEGSLLQVHQRATEVFESSRRINAVAVDLGESIESAAAVSSELADSTTTISSMGRQISEAASVLNRSLVSVGESAASVASVARDAVTEADTASTEMDKLDVAGKRIGEIVDVINTIAEQTHILAINASIEAARAGEAGRGFAVVADEVRNLAAATAAATAEIKKRARAVEDGNEVARSSLERIVATIQNIAAAQRTIAGDVEKQGRATEEISRGINELHVASTTVAGGAKTAATQAAVIKEQRERLLSYAEELSKVADSADRLLQRFTLRKE
jgi:methyl-accepting chemotaxis protein